MAARSPGKSKSRTSGRTKSRSSSASGKKSASKAKTGSSRKTKSKSSARNVPLISRIKTNLFFLAFGLIGGVVGTLLALYLSQALWFQNDTQPVSVTSKQKVDSGLESRAVQPVFEENDKLDRQIKRVDLILYRVFRDFDIPEKNIQFSKLARMRANGHEWHHASMDIQLPPRLEAGLLQDGLKLALAKFSHDFPVDLDFGGHEGQSRWIKIRLNGLLTHTLNLKAGENTDGTSELETKKALPKVAIVIDDMGVNYRHAQCFIAFKAPLALSVLPFQKYSQKVAQAGYKAGKVIMLHMPMEPAQYPKINPGPEALLMSMSRGETLDSLRTAIKDIPNVVGVNNHMGSRLTEDAERMAWILEELKTQGLFFFDSRTTTRSRAYDLALKLGVKTASRHVFLDNIQEWEAISIQVRRLVALARQTGEAIAIGHPYPITCQVLEKEYNFLISKVDLVPITELLH